MNAKDLTSELLAAMESEPSGISDGNNSGLPFASKSASMLPVDSSPFSNLGNDDPLSTRISTCLAKHIGCKPGKVVPHVAKILKSCWMRLLPSQLLSWCVGVEISRLEPSTVQYADNNLLYLPNMLLNAGQPNII